jgi:hypothetical protein
MFLEGAYDTGDKLKGLSGGIVRVTMPQIGKLRWFFPVVHKHSALASIPNINKPQLLGLGDDRSNSVWSPPIIKCSALLTGSISWMCLPNKLWRNLKKIV